MTDCTPTLPLMNHLFSFCSAFIRCKFVSNIVLLQCGCQCPPKYQNVDVTLPSNPDVSGDKYATFPGTIGYAKNGVAIFNPLNGPGQNAVTGPDMVRNVPQLIST